MTSSPVTAWQIEGEKVEGVTDFLFLGSQITVDGDCHHEIRRRLLFGRKAMKNLDSVLKSRNITLPANVCIVKAMIFPVVTYGCESWTVKKAGCWRIDTFVQGTPESSLDSREIKPVNLKGDQPWIVTERTDAEAEAPAVCCHKLSSNANRWLIGQVPDAGKDQGQKEKRVSEDEVAGQHHQCNEHELWQTLGDGEGQGGLEYCSPCGSRVGHDWATEQQQLWLHPLLNQGEGRGGSATMYQSHKMSVVNILFINIRSLVGLWENSFIFQGKEKWSVLLSDLWSFYFIPMIFMSNIPTWIWLIKRQHENFTV